MPPPDSLPVILLILCEKFVILQVFANPDCTAGGFELLVPLGVHEREGTSG
jgi:hypothetical protein